MTVQPIILGVLRIYHCLMEVHVACRLLFPLLLVPVVAGQKSPAMTDSVEDESLQAQMKWGGKGVLLR